MVFHGYRVVACAAAACVPFVGKLKGICGVGGAFCVAMVMAVEAVVAAVTVVAEVAVVAVVVVAVAMVAVTVAQGDCGGGGMVMGLCVGAA